MGEELGGGSLYYWCWRCGFKTMESLSNLLQNEIKSDRFILCNTPWLDWKALWFWRNLSQYRVTLIEKKEKMSFDMNLKLKATYNIRQLSLLKDQDFLYNTIEEHQQQS